MEYTQIYSNNVKGGQLRSTKVTKPKLRRVLGSQNRTSGELRGRLGVGPRGLWADSGGSEEGPREISRQKKKSQINSYLPVRPKTVPNNLFDNFLRSICSGLAGPAGLVGSRKFFYVAQFRNAPEFLLTRPCRQSVRNVLFASAAPNGHQAIGPSKKTSGNLETPGQPCRCMACRRQRRCAGISVGGFRVWVLSRVCCLGPPRDI